MLDQTQATVEDIANARLDNTQLIRESIIKQLTEDKNNPGKIRIPTDKVEVALLTTMLSQMDSQEINKKKIKTEEKAISTAAAAADSIAELLLKVKPGKILPTEIIEDVQVKTLPDSTTDTPVVDGSMHIGVIEETYESFIKRVGE